jgi:hypothetical protein
VFNTVHSARFSVTIFKLPERKGKQPQAWLAQLASALGLPPPLCSGCDYPIGYLVIFAAGCRRGERGDSYHI